MNLTYPWKRAGRPKGPGRRRATRYWRYRLTVPVVIWNDHGWRCSCFACVMDRAARGARRA